MHLAAERKISLRNIEASRFRVKKRQDEHAGFQQAPLRPHGLVQAGFVHSLAGKYMQVRRGSMRSLRESKRTAKAALIIAFLTFRYFSAASVWATCLRFSASWQNAHASTSDAISR